jgi:SAM-dependent methyltransferase
MSGLLSQMTSGLRQTSSPIVEPAVEPAVEPVVEPDPNISTAPWDVFQRKAADLPDDARVVEFGTRRAGSAATHSHGFFANVPRENYVMADLHPGDDVDVIADLHGLPAEWTGQFDACVANAVFEHVARPWIAAREIHRILRPGGFCLVATHQTFPLHDYPSDYFRFSVPALRVIFEDAGFEGLEFGYRYRARILSEVVAPELQEDWNRQWPSYVLVAALVQKPR